MVVGGYALAFYGYVRGTGDIDLWIKVSDENAQLVWNALKNFGAPLFDLKMEDLKTYGMVFQMGLPPNRIDIINKIEGVEYDDAFVNRTFVDLESMRIPVIARTDLLKNKRTMSRPKDMGDIAWLENN